MRPISGHRSWLISSPTGNLQGLKPGQLKALERLYKRRFPKDAVWSLDQAREIAVLSASIKRQLGLLIDRKGKVQMVLAGQANSIYIPELPTHAGKGLNGLRLLHTHFGQAELSREDLLDMLFLRFDAAIALNVSEMGEPVSWQAAWLLPETGKSPQPWFVQPVRAWHDCQIDFNDIIAQSEHKLADQVLVSDNTASAILISVATDPVSIQERNLDELAELARTAGICVKDRLIQRIIQPNPKLILGKGKLAELEIMALNANAEILIFDGELTPAQLHNLADITERKVLDRTLLILDIFAQHAKSKAGKLQVELAQLAYARPRLAGQKRALDRLMGGIGGRGPGESKLETDRRRIRQRMAFLNNELDKLRMQRKFARNRRSRNNLPQAALVGYTNAGKSTLLNALTKSCALVEDKLFATLDPQTRRLRFPKEREIILADTVGFIRNLPEELLEAFRATLEELESADLLIHISDASHPDYEQQINSVNSILDELDLQNKEQILVLNKCDALDESQKENLKAQFPNAVLISASQGTNLEHLLRRVEQAFFMEKIAKRENFL